MQKFSITSACLALLLWAPLDEFMEQKDGKIVLRNPSFEDSPGASKIPRSWMTVGLGSTPDIMPGAWGVAGSPQEGLPFLL